MNNLYTNGNYNLELIGTFNGTDYAVFKQLNAWSDTNNYIIAWMADFKNNTVSWSQGHYDMSLEAVKEYLNNMDVSTEVSDAVLGVEEFLYTDEEMQEINNNLYCDTYGTCEGSRCSNYKKCILDY